MYSWSSNLAVCTSVDIFHYAHFLLVNREEGEVVVHMWCMTTSPYPWGAVACNAFYDTEPRGDEEFE